MHPACFEDILARLPGARQSGDNWVAPCPLPGHKTPAGHVSLKDAGDKALVTCQGGKHSYPDFCQAWGYDSLNYSDMAKGRGGGGYSTVGKRCNSATPDALHERPTCGRGVAPTVAPPREQCNGATADGLTLASLAEAKHLPAEYLETVGLSDFRYSGRAAVRIPYLTEAGEVIAVRFRLSLDGDRRFVWRCGDRVNLYGLERLPHARELGWVLVVEGESDCWTCWHQGVPAIGVPGKSTWRAEWAQALDGLDVYVWVEPDADGFAVKIGESIPSARVVAAPEGIKDVSEAHCQGVDVPSLVAGLTETAEAVETFRARLADTRVAELRVQAQRVLDCHDPLVHVEKAIRGMGYGGDVTPAIVTYLAATSRLLAMRQGTMPVHLLLAGQSAAGKSYTLNTVKRLLPPEAYHEIDAGSSRVLIYDDAPLRHRALVFGEADSLPAGEDNPAASAIRNLLQDHQLHYRVTVKDKATGDYAVREVNKEGPTVLLTTSTRSLGEQLSTRLFTLEVSDSQAQIAAAMETQANLEVGAETPPDGSLVAFQAYLQAKAPWRVVVPFAPGLASGISGFSMAPRLLRDFARLLSLVKAVALLRHTKRDVDAGGRIVAEIGDYETVRALLEDVYTETVGGPTAAIRELVEAVRQMDTGGRVTVGRLATHLGLNKSTVSRRAKKAVGLGWLVNRESRRGRPADYTLGDPLPDPCALPRAEQVLHCCRTSEGTQQSVQQCFEPESGDCCTVALVTDGRATPSPPSSTAKAVDTEQGGMRI